MSKPSKIIISSKFCKIEDEEDADFLSRLSANLSFKYEGAEFTQAFKSHRWDGKEYLLSKKLIFMTGLLDRVKTFYKDNNKELDLHDTREQFVFGNEIDISENIKKLGITPYDYQIAAVEKALENERIIFKHATGSGKSLSIAMITAKLGLPTICWVVGIDILQQFHDLFSKLFDQKIGMIGNGICEIEPISIVSVWTIGRMLGIKKNELFLDDLEDEKYEPTDRDKVLKLISEAKIHHFDECHYSSAKTIRTIYKNINPSKLYGWSGSLDREDGSDLLIEGILGSNIHEVKASELIRRNILAKPHIKFLYVKGKAHYTDTYAKVYSDNIINNEYRNNLIVSETSKLLEKGYKVLVLFKNIAHGKILKDLFDGKDIEVGYLSGKNKSEIREETKKNFLEGRLNCLLCSMIFDTGVDLPNITGLVLTGSQKSSIKVLQRLGRSLRSGKDKHNGVAVIEFYDNCKYLTRHSLIRKSIYETEPEFEIRMPKEYVEK